MVVMVIISVVIEDSWHFEKYKEKEKKKVNALIAKKIQAKKIVVLQ